MTMLTTGLPVAVIWILMIAVVVAFLVFRGSTRQPRADSDKPRADLGRKESQCQPRPGEATSTYLVRYGDTEVLNRPVNEAIQELERLIVAHSTEKSFLWYCRYWLFDCYVAVNDLDKAIACFPLPDTPGRAANNDTLLSLKLATGQRITGRDVLTLDGFRITQWGMKHLGQIEEYLDASVAAVEKREQINLLERWRELPHTTRCFHRFYAARYSVTGARLPTQSNLRCYSFNRNPEVVRFAAEMTREAENAVREEMSFPRVGEGWVAETTLYTDLCHAFQNTEVVHHACPPWLDPQHLDVFFPEYGVAIEYQGPQHDKPVAYFGGEEAFRKTQRRDETKRRLCTENGVRLIYVRAGYKLPEVVCDIEKKRLESHS
jgi:hypothetical protein